MGSYGQFVCGSGIATSRDACSYTGRPGGTVSAERNGLLSCRFRSTLLFGKPDGTINTPPAAPEGCHNDGQTHRFSPTYNVTVNVDRRAYCHTSLHLIVCKRGGKC